MRRTDASIEGLAAQYEPCLLPHGLENSFWHHYWRHVGSDGQFHLDACRAGPVAIVGRQSDDSAGGHHYPIVAALADTIPAGDRSRNEHLDATSGRTDGSMSTAR